MATVIKSNNISTNNIGNLLETSLPSEGLTGFFDFSNGRYFAKGSPVALGEVIDVGRLSPATGLDKSGNMVTYPNNTPRFHLVKSVNKYGLTLGDVKRNHFLNSNAPVTQTITIDEGTENKFFLVVECEGSGSVTISGAYSGTATQTAPLIIRTPTKAPFTITATVNGSLSFVSVSKQTSAYGIDPSRVVTSGASVQKIQDVTSVKRDLFNTLYSATGSSTIFMKMVKFDGGDNSLPTLSPAKNIEIFRAFGSVENGGYVCWLEMTYGDSGKVFVRKQKNGVIEDSAKVDVSWGKTNITAFRSNKQKGDVFVNGKFSKSTVGSIPDVDPTMFMLPSLITPVNSALIAPNSILTYLIVYDRELTDAEVQQVYEMLK
ncbi:hypothetical protein ACS126_17970 [Sphingobacterium lactis]|uniref:hypothetical protein n=1 Tax=Sphingobacterium lactis TaxID=797291 RepID=UPI003EC7536F